MEWATRYKSWRSIRLEEFMYYMTCIFYILFCRYYKVYLQEIFRKSPSFCRVLYVWFTGYRFRFLSICSYIGISDNVHTNATQYLLFPSVDFNLRVHAFCESWFFMVQQLAPKNILCITVFMVFYRNMSWCCSIYVTMEFLWIVEVCYLHYVDLCCVHVKMAAYIYEEQDQCWFIFLSVSNPQT